MSNVTGKIRVIDRTGDTVIEWDTAQALTVETAAQAFERFIQEGYTAYAWKVADGSPGEVVTEFPETAVKIIMAPQMAGG